MAALQLVLVPLSRELAVPDVRLIAGSLCVAVFLACGWSRACRRHSPQNPASPATAPASR
jgi:hypothetical protein